MPKILRVRAAHDEREEKQVRKLAASRHGPADWILHARMVARRWDGERVEAIAKELQCSPQTVRRRLHRFDAEGIEGLGDRPKPGRPRRLTTQDDSRLIALLRQGVRWRSNAIRRLSSWVVKRRDKDFVPKGPRSAPPPPSRRRGRRRISHR